MCYRSDGVEPRSAKRSGGADRPPAAALQPVDEVLSQVGKCEIESSPCDRAYPHRWSRWSLLITLKKAAHVRIDVLEV